MIGTYTTVGKDTAQVAYRAPDGTWIGHVARVDGTCDPMGWEGDGRCFDLTNKLDRLDRIVPAEDSAVAYERMAAMEGK